MTERIERTLQETPHLDFLRSYTSAGVTTIFVTLQGSTPASEVPDIWYHVRKSVGDIRHTLPAGVVGPGFNDEFGDTFGIIYGFTADGFTHRELRDYVEDVRARLLRVADVSKVEILGAQDEKIIIEFSTDKLAGLGIDRGDVIAALRAQNAVSPAGILQTGDERLALRVSGAFGSELDILAINIASNGAPDPPRRHCRSPTGLRRSPQPMFRVNGKPAIGVAIAMRDGGDILTLGRNVQRTMDAITAELPVGIEPVLVADQSSVVRGAIGEFMTSLWQAIAIIMAVSVLQPRRARRRHRRALDSADARDRVSGHAVRQHRPAAHFARRAHHRADLAGRRRHEHDRCHDARAWREGDRQGTGRHLRLQDAGVSRCSPGSFVTIGGLRADRVCRERGRRIHVLDLRGRRASRCWRHGSSRFCSFRCWAWRCCRRRSTAQRVRARQGRADLPPGARCRHADAMDHHPGDARLLRASRSSPFPMCRDSSSRRPTGRSFWSICGCRRMRRSMPAAIARPGSMPSFAGDPDVERWSTYVGRGAIRFYLPLSVELPNDFFSQFVIVAKDVAARERLRAKLERVLRDDFPSAVSRIVPLELGPPVGWPVQYRVSGPDVTELRDIAFRLAQIVASDSRSRRVNFDWIEPGRKIRVRIDQDQARLLGLSSGSIAAVMNTVMSGAAVTQVRDGIYLVDVVMRATDEQRVSLSTLRNLQFPLPNGRTVPLGVFATLRFRAGVSADLAPRRRPDLDRAGRRGAGRLARSRGQSRSRRRSRSSTASLPQVLCHCGRRHGRGERAVASLGLSRVIPLMLFIAVTLLMMQLQSFSLLFLVLSVVPMGLIGVVAALLLFRQAARLRGDPRDPVAARNDRAQRRDPDRSDRGRARRGRGRLERGHRGRHVALPPDHADRDIDGARHDPDRAHHLLGADGLRDHGRATGGDAV